jgi:hypothetical protein
MLALRRQYLAIVWLTLISEITGKKADVPADETKIVAVDVMPTINVG